MKTAIVFLALIGPLCLTVTPSVQAQTERLAVAPKAGTLGLGTELIVRITPNIDTRLGINALNAEFDLEFSDIDYKTNFDLLSYSALVDWYVLNNPFRISGGILLNESEADFIADAAGSYKIGDNPIPYPASAVGTLRADLDYDQEIAPYLGIGWGNPFDQEKQWGLMCDFGVVYTDTPNVRLSHTGTVTAADIAAEEDKIENDLDKIKFYPVLSVSLCVRF